jgi:tRNA threonylcarbamoyladenosine biosynthesis protein TsaE
MGAADTKSTVPRSLPQRLPAAFDGLRLKLATAMATQKLGRLLAADAQPGDLLALKGPLGAGKTCLVTGLARGLGIREAITSPSFALVNQHRGRLTLYHVDLYRLHDGSELDELGLWEAAEEGGLLVIEWLERFPQAVAADRLHIALTFPAAGDRGRMAEITAAGPRSQARLLALSQRLS